MYVVKDDVNAKLPLENDLLDNKLDDPASQSSDVIWKSRDIYKLHNVASVEVSFSRSFSRSFEPLLSIPSAYEIELWIRTAGPSRFHLAVNDPK